MVDFEIGIRDRALKNLLVLLLIPIVTLVWILTFFGLMELQAAIWPLYGATQGLTFWAIFTFIFGLISFLELVAIFHIGSESKM